jgi:NitT/TauT family transport system ATP-binding protein
VLTLDKRRHDPHAPHRYGAGVVYDLALTRKLEQAHPEPEPIGASEAVGITIDTIGNN